MQPEYIVDVTESDFDYQVLAFSQNKPVVVDFWADWCKPCKRLSPFLEMLISEASGTFRLARVDADANPALAFRCAVHSLPTVQAYSNGSMVASFVGLMPENQVREFFDRITPPSPANLQVEKGNSLLAINRLQQSREAFEEALKISPENPGANLGLLKLALIQGQFQEANRLFREFPASREYEDAEKLRPLIKAMLDFSANSLPEETDLDTAFNNSIRLAQRGNLPASIDGLLDILRADPHYRRDKARLVILSMLELMDPEGDQTLAYRKELTNILFK
ncbi:MAG: tetratricopeptide repeat protein [Anaerolineaceae bacterium]